jgi:hypothetical protein
VRILLLNDNTEHPNWGAQATPFALKKMFRERIPGVEIETLSWSWIRTRIRELRFPLPFFGRLTFRRDEIPFANLVYRILARRIQFFPQVRDDFDYFADRWAAGSAGGVAGEFVEAARHADVLVYNGENSLYRNTLEGCRSVFLLHFAKTRMGKPACAVNQTAHITGVRPIMKAMVESVYPKLDLVSTREPRSWRRLRELGVTSARLSADAVFYLCETDDARQRVTAWQSRHGLGPGGYFCLSASGLPVSRPREGWDGEVTNFVRTLDSLGLRAVLVARDPDCQFLEEVARRTGAVYFGPDHDFPELWPLFRDAAFVITGHFHYAIIASIVGCPFVPLSANNHKMAGVCEQLGWHLNEPHDITFLAKESSAIVAEARLLLENRQEFSAQLEKRAVELRELAAATADWVREAAEAGEGRPGGSP